MRPIDLLTDEDKQLIVEYSTSYASVEPSSVEEVLFAWNKNKKQLLKVFGNQLRISIPIEVEADQKHLKQRYRALYYPLSMFDEFDFTHFEPDPRNHPFMNTLGQWMRDNYANNMMTYFKGIIDLTKYCHCESGKTLTEHIFRHGRNGKDLKIPAGTKTMRAIRKALEYYNFPYMEMFDQWRDELSVVFTDKNIKSNMVFSIHPIDYMTMSDNRCGWTSCMSWISRGGYSTGTIEMMNSDVAIVVYLESTADNFIFNGHKIPNKSWRTLAFIHKDILLIGKHYPYQSELLAKTALRELQKIIKDNVGWTYQYKEQLYLDLINSHNNRYVKENMERRKHEHKIFTYMNIMYHDMIQDHDTKYWCCRNYVKKSLYLNLSGKATCMCCGEPIDKDGFDDIDTSHKCCEDCMREYGCPNCRQVSKNRKTTRVKIRNHWGASTLCRCHDCLTNDFVFDNIDGVFVEKRFLTKYNKCMDLPTNMVRRYRPVTEEVIKQNEVCCAV